MIKLATFWCDRRAAAAATFALMLPAMVGAVGFGIDAALI